MSVNRAGLGRGGCLNGRLGFNHIATFVQDRDRVDISSLEEQQAGTMVLLLTRF
jgi:hypothetical protein